MSLLGGITGGGVLGIAEQVGLAAATGGSSLLVETAMKGVMLSVGDQVLQQLGKGLGLPPSVVDMASAVMHAEAGDIGGAQQSVENAVSGLGQSIGGGASDTGAIQNGVFDAQQYLLNNLLEKLQNGEFNGEGNAKAKAAKAAAGGGAAGAAGGATGATGASSVSSGGDGDSFLLKLAEALGKVIDSKMDQMVDVAGQIDSANGSGDKSQTATLSAKETALGQEVSLISNALNTAIKSLGDAASTLARKT